MKKLIAISFVSFALILSGLSASNVNHTIILADEEHPDHDSSDPGEGGH
ncbi:hypothetical protein GMD78_05215 [Ornithinibacillus sp. L9]|uniref:Phr family secreted Rap phosphatase inhibitor n=1 Tax=Ornithinibacillus caprae TaxID=2678566 RepID=A0A6N8FE47_9BACI|nr:hypothetical protein [Ornithinibacillus caprae]MUK87800.1 hypothetical protein [Ornithinibacillus caprae]